MAKSNYALWPGTISPQKIAWASSCNLANFKDVSGQTGYILPLCLLLSSPSLIPLSLSLTPLSLSPSLPPFSLSLCMCAISFQLFHTFIFYPPRLLLHPFYILSSSFSRSRYLFLSPAFKTFYNIIELIKKGLCMLAFSHFTDNYPKSNEKIVPSKLLE